MDTTIQMKISVIIPVKNRANLLPITLDNVLAQTLPPYEVIVVDDSSTDSIDDVIIRYKERVFFIKSTGAGPSAARNSGLKFATGNLIQFFDSDDLMTKNKLQVQADLLQKNNADFVYGPWVKAMQENGDWKQTDVIMQYFPIPKGKLANYVLEGWCNITQSVLFQRSLIDEVGFWREDLMPHEDYEYWFRISKLVTSYVHENESCVIYRQHQKQITDLDVSEKARWLDGFRAKNLIAAGTDFHPSLFSLLLFKGSMAASKQNFVKKFGQQKEMELLPVEHIFKSIFKVQNKLGRMKTGTSWQKMHGVLTHGQTEFLKCINNL